MVRWRLRISEIELDVIHSRGLGTVLWTHYCGCEQLEQTKLSLGTTTLGWASPLRAPQNQEGHFLYMQDHDAESDRQGVQLLEVLDLSHTTR